MDLVVHNGGTYFLRRPSLIHTPIYGIHACIKNSRSVLPLFSISNNFSFVHISCHTTFRFENLQFTKTFEKNVEENIYLRKSIPCLPHSSCNVLVACKV
jgi:hypothetical protein